MATSEIEEPPVQLRPTIWGLTPTELHDRFWAARGVQVVRPGQPSELAEDAELFLLIAPRLLTIFRLRELIAQLSWVQPDVIWVRLRHDGDRSYRETAVAGTDGTFVSFRRLYGGSDARLARVALTPNLQVARFWQSARDASEGWRQLRSQVAQHRRIAASINARTYDRRSESEVAAFARDLVKAWQRPDATVAPIRRIEAQVWGDVQSQVNKTVTFIGPAWIGAGRILDSPDTVVGPAILWDRPEARAGPERLDWRELEPTKTFSGPVRFRERSGGHAVAKRVFDVVFASVMLVLLLPIFPVVMLAIYLEDGRPFLFGQRREGRAGKPFLCLKFRSMRRDAEHVRARLSHANQADGPQFYIGEDPRVTRVGRLLRRFYLDELPQLFNVLLGHMSIVGPRPSPREENQCCPAWREARLSVKPGITGLWQVMRTRQAGRDFQEWIKYDIEYVEKASFWLDLRIIFKTFVCFIRSFSCTVQDS